jgi:Tfp pilus assembly protein PilF
MKGVCKQCTVLAVAVATAFLLCSCAGNPEKAKLRFVESGKAYMQKGAYSSAAIEFRNALKIDPKFAEGYFQLAQADLAQGDGNSAYQDVGNAIQLDPTRADARLLRARIYLIAAAEQKKPEYLTQAADDINSVLKQDPQNADAHNLLASVLANQKKYDQALQELNTVVKLEPSKASPYMHLGMIQTMMKRPADAEESFKKAVELEPKSENAYIGLANFYRWERRPDEADAVLQQGAQQIPGDMKIYMDWAASLASDGKNSEADATLKVLRDYSPKSVPVASAIGDYYMQHNMSTQALQEYQRGLAIDPRNLEMQQKLEDIYLVTGQIDLAANVDAALQKQAPTNTTNKINHGRLLMAQGKAQDAVTALQKAAADAGSDNEAHYYLGMAYWKSGDTLQANSEFQNALRITPGLPIVLRALTQLNLAESNFSVAQIYAQELVQENAADTSDRLLLGETLAQQGKYLDAESQFLAAKQSAPNDPAVHLNLALLYQAEKKLSDADKEFQTAMQAAPQDSAVLAQYDQYLAARGELAKATTLTQQFVADNPKDVGARILLSNVHLQAKDYAAARSEAEKAIQLDQNSISPYLQLGQVFSSQNDYNSALQAYQKALGLQPDNAAVTAEIGNLYLKQNDLAKAGAQFQKALEISPNFATAENNLAWVYAEQGQNLDVALGLAQKAISQAPNLVSFTDTLGWVMYKKGDYSEAIPYLQVCVKKSPDSGQYRYHLGMALVASGQKTQGKALLQAALKMNLDPSDLQQARQALAREN